MPITPSIQSLQHQISEMYLFSMFQACICKSYEASKNVDIYNFDASSLYYITIFWLSISPSIGHIFHLFSPHLPLF